MGFHTPPRIPLLTKIYLGRAEGKINKIQRFPKSLSDNCKCFYFLQLLNATNKCKKII